MDDRLRRRVRTLVRAVPLLVLGIALWPESLGGSTAIAVVEGDSMLPSLAPGDVVVTRSRSSYSEGDVVVFRLSGGPARVVHRVEHVEPDGRLVTRGDNREVADGFPVTSGDVMGETVLRIPGAGGWLQRLSAPWVLGALAGALAALRLWTRTGEVGGSGRSVRGVAPPHLPRLRGRWPRPGP